MNRLPSQIIDNHGRPITYLRLAVTDRCNLRCYYCMPQESMKFLPKEEILSYEEMLRIISVLAKMGVSKVRITGGEPMVRRDIIPFMKEVSGIKGVEHLHMTTNGVLLKNQVESLKNAGVKGINLSLDTLDRNKFLEITRRDDFEKVMSAFFEILEYDIPLKLNVVVMGSKNADELVSMAELALRHKVGIRFIEEMPFNGAGREHAGIEWNYKKIIDSLKQAFPTLKSTKASGSATAQTFTANGFVGDVGVIPAHSRTFCGSCNRIRLNALGDLRTCLYGNNVLSIRDVLRSGASGFDIGQAFLGAIDKRKKDGFEAEKARMTDTPIAESMSVIGG